MTEEYQIERALGFSEESNDWSIFDFLASSIEKYGEVYIEEFDYQDKIIKAAKNIVARNRRIENVFFEIKDVINYAKRIPEIAERISVFAPATLKFAAATERINLYPYERVEYEDFLITFMENKKEFTINIEKDNNPFVGNYGFVVKYKGLEEKIYLKGKTGRFKQKLLNENETIVNDDVKLYFFID